MGKRQRALEDVGLAALAGEGAMDERIVRAVAAMLVAKPATKTTPKRPLPFSPQAVYDRLFAECPDKLALGAYSSRDFARLGATMHTMPDLVPEDLDRLVVWVQTGGVDKWPVKPTFAHVVTNFNKLVAWARARESGGVAALFDWTTVKR